MSFKKKLFATIGPLCLALLILGGIFLSPLKFRKVDANLTATAANSMAVNVIKGDIIKNEAMKDPRYVPFFGSSEFSRFNAFHPSVLAEQYNRNYRPFLLGAAGTQSLSQFFMLQSMAKEMKGKKAVFVISPQWFVKGGVSKEMFSLYFSPLQTYRWAVQTSKTDEMERYTAQRLLRFKNVASDATLKAVLQQISVGEELSVTQKKMCQLKINMLSREDELFGHVGMIDHDSKIMKGMRTLPETYDFHKLDKLAYNTGQEKTKTNPYQITDKFYNKRIAPVEGTLKGAQEDFDYRQSVEFSDFQLFLNEVAKLKMDVLFVIPPVNERWSDYTGLSTDMLDEFSLKINHQLKDQGFKHILDLTDRRGEDYFMEDTIHIGWRGWLEMDKAIAPFLKEVKAKPIEYQLNDDYYSKEWQNLEPTNLN